MANQYSLFVVVDGKEYGVELAKSHYSEEEAKEAMKGLQDAENAWFILVDGGMISINRKNCNFYFICKKIGE